MKGIHRKSSNAGPQLPKTQLVILSICRFAEPVALTGVFPYLPEMIESFGIPQTDVAYWAGVTSAVFSLAQCTTAIAWGRASDRYGRKPIIMLALFCAMTTSLIFGFSRSLIWAIVARALSGAANGNVGILRTTVAELVPQKVLQPRAFSIMPLIWTIGSIVGPIIGGALASPATKFPGLFGNSVFFQTFPFALPNLANAFFFIIGITSGILFLRESLETKKHRKDYGRLLGQKLTSCSGTRSRELRLRDEYDSLQSMGSKRKEDLGPPAYSEVFTYQSSLALLTYCILALHAVAYDQLLPVFMHLPRQEQKGEFSLIKFGGGFGLESGRIGVIFSAFGFFAMVMQFTVFPAVTSRLGALYCMRVVTLILPIAYILTPYTVLMPTPELQQAAILAVMLFKAIGGVFAFPCITIIFTNSASSVRLLGTLNGVATSLSAIGRAIGPFLCGKAFTWGVEHDYAVAAWWLLALFAIPGHIVTWWLVEGEGFVGASSEPASEESRFGENRDSIGMDKAGITRKATGTDEDTIPLRHDSVDVEDSEDEDGQDDRPLLNGKGTKSEMNAL